MKTRVLWLVPQAHAGRIPAGVPSMFDLIIVHSIPEALLFLRNSSCEVVVVSCSEPDAALDDALLEIRRCGPALPLVVDCVRVAVNLAVRLTKLGACDVWSGTLTSPAVCESLHAAVEFGAPPQFGCEQERWSQSLVGESEAMRRIKDVIRLVAARRSTVLITGETGTGKEIVARAIHDAGGRDRLPFVAVNCAAIPETLIESELFGHAKGAFTGATQSRTGRFEQANGGTIFLDEVGELPPAMQVKLLRVLQQREIQRLGSNETVSLNVRVIAATNADLEAAVRTRVFREDLYYRLNVVPLHLPSLRERGDDMLLLAEYFLSKICALERLPRKTLSAGAADRLCRCAWPGNVRQLEHAVEMAVVLSGDRPVLEAQDFAVLSQTGNVTRDPAPIVRLPDEGLDFDETLTSIEWSILQQALARSGGNKARAAELLRMKRTTLLAKLKSIEEARAIPVQGCVPQRFFAVAG